MLRFKSLGSGSAGNATLIEATGLLPTRLLVDCGLGLRQLVQRLGVVGLALENIDAIFITHEHGDHIGCAQNLSMRQKIPVWMSRGTYEAIGTPDFERRLFFAKDGQPIDMGNLQITPFTVPHDAREPLQLTCTDGVSKLGILTDLGHATAHIHAHLSACHALLLECNHDADLLAQSNYPTFLKQRISGRFGHLENAAASSIAQAINHPKLQHVVAAHLSRQNNRPDLVQTLLAQALRREPQDVLVATQNEGCPWLQL